MTCNGIYFIDGLGWVGLRKLDPCPCLSLGHVTPTIFGSTVGYHSDSLFSCLNCFAVFELCQNIKFWVTFKWSLSTKTILLICHWIIRYGLPDSMSVSMSVKYLYSANRPSQRSKLRCYVLHALGCSKATNDCNIIYESRRSCAQNNRCTWKQQININLSLIEKQDWSAICQSFLSQT